MMGPEFVEGGAGVHLISAEGRDLGSVVDQARRATNRWLEAQEPSVVRSVTTQHTCVLDESRQTWYSVVITIVYERLVRIG